MTYTTEQMIEISKLVTLLNEEQDLFVQLFGEELYNVIDDKIMDVTANFFAYKQK